MIDPQTLGMAALIATGMYGWAWAFAQWDDKDWMP